jgi:hypothetical protein
MHECMLIPSYDRSIYSTCIISHGEDDVYKHSEISEYTVSRFKITSYFSFILKIFPRVGHFSSKIEQNSTSAVTQSFVFPNCNKICSLLLKQNFRVILSPPLHPLNEGFML